MKKIINFILWGYPKQGAAYVCYPPKTIEIAYEDMKRMGDKAPNTQFTLYIYTDKGTDFIGYSKAYGFQRG